MGNTETPDIIYTKVDEAPELASASLLPIIRRFARAAGISVGQKDISLAGRILATFPENLRIEQQIPDDLALLGELVKTPQANVIKLPNISASVPQLVAAVKELQDQGYAIPDYPENPADETEREMHAMLIRQIEAQRNGADGSFLARDWLKEAGTRPARCVA